MTGQEIRALEAAATAIFPANVHPELTVGAEDLDVRGYFEGLFERSSLRVAAGLHLAILFCALSPIFILGKLSTLASLSLEDRQKAVTGLLASPIYAVRQLVLLLKVHLAMLLGGHDVARAIMQPDLASEEHRSSALLSAESLVKPGPVKGQTHDRVA